MLLAVVVFALTMALAFAGGATHGQPVRPSGSEPSGASGATQEQLAIEREKLELDRQRLALEERRDRYTLLAALGAAIALLIGFLAFLASQDARIRERFRGDIDSLTSLEADVDPARRVAVALGLPWYYRARSWLRPWSRPFSAEVVNLIAVCLKLRGCERRAGGSSGPPDRSPKNGSPAPVQAGAEEREPGVAQAKQRVFYDALASAVRDISLQARRPFAGVDMRQADLSELDLRKANLAAANLPQADLRRAHLMDADLIGAYLTRANLTGAILFTADLSGAHLFNADLSGAHLMSADLSGADLSGAQLRGAYLSHAHLSRAHLDGADLTHASLGGAQLSGALLSGAHLSGADLSGADLSGAQLRAAYLSHAHLSRAHLDGADLRDAHLSGAVLSRAALSRAVLSGARLTRANLTGANLTGANLSGADLSEAQNLDSARFSEDTTLPDGAKWRPGMDLTQFTKLGSGPSGTGDEQASPPTD